MYELVQITEHSYYINCPAKIGLYLANGSEAYLIDSGSDKDAGRKVRQILDKNNWHLKAIFNTHSNADHIGGNQYLQRQTGCKIYGPAIEYSFTNHPILEPSFLYGGFPPQDLRHKFLLAQESTAELLTESVLPKGMEIIPLPGHFFNMAGYRTPDHIIYLADCLSSKETLEKYQIGFLYDAAAYLDTLEMVKTLQADLFVPAHAEAAKSVAALAQYNIDKVHEIADHILSLCEEPQTFEEILKKLFDAYKLTLNFEQYVLVGSTVRSYLAWLKDTGRLKPVFQDNWLRWQRQG
ncbi:MBL fold metallo-hydrolase [bacterium 1XD42-1]|nr:MBL fold metallo-hydrolase [bacterium 1XD42-8]RKJ63650.1 MBL fold metallo-hydrolase [bacterium 1XD42-1]